MEPSKPIIEIRTGSDSDISRIHAAYKLLGRLGIGYSPRILSAHRTPEVMSAEARALQGNGFRVSICAAGGSAHLPGMTASETLLPVIGIPVPTNLFGGIDSLLSIIQMPDGIPVGTAGIGQAEQAALLAAQIASLDQPAMRNRIRLLRGILQPVKDDTALQRHIGILLPPDFEAGKAAYQQLLALLGSMALQYTECSLSGTGESACRSLLQEWENKGTLAIIAVQALQPGTSARSYIPAYATQTDLPVIVLPVLQNSENWVSAITALTEQVFSAAGESLVPLIAMGVNRYLNAGLFAAQVAGLYFPAVRQNLESYRRKMAGAVRDKDSALLREGVGKFL